MKGNYFFIVILLSLVLLACDKNEVEQAVAIAEIQSEIQSKHLDMRLRTLWGEWNWHSLPPQAFFTPWFCAWPSNNCLPTFTISGLTAPQDLERFLGHIETGTSASFFSGNEYKNTFGIVDSFPTFHNLLVSGSLAFDVQASDTLDRHLYVIGYDSESGFERTEDAVVVFEIDIN